MPTIYTDFSSRDFTAIYERLIDILRQELPELTDMNHADAGIALARLLARTSDALSYQIDKSFSESFIDSCNFRQSAINLARTLDLLIKGATAASTTLTITGDGLLYPVVIPAYTAVMRSDGVEYVTLSEITIPAGVSATDVTVVQGEYTEYSLAYSDFYYNTRSGRYYYNLGTNVCFNHVWMVEDEVIIWENVDSFWRSLPEDRHFRLDLYADLFNGTANTVNITIGDNTKGYAPTSGNFKISFIRCSGPEGNTGANTITDAFNILRYVPSQDRGKITITNTISATGGSYGETLTDFKSRLPAVVRTQRRGVTKPDYKALVTTIPGVKRCQAIDRNIDPLVPWEHTVLYVVPEGGGDMSPELTESIYNELTTWGHHGNWRGRYILNNALQHIVNVVCSVGIDYGFNALSVVSNVNSAITSFFSVDNLDIYQLMDFGELHRTVMAVSGVSWVEFSSPAIDIQPDYGYIITLGTLSVTASS